MAFERLRESLTKGNLWMYILSELRNGRATPGELRRSVTSKRGFSPASITFYSVLYRLRREGLVRKSTDMFRSSYEITPAGVAELERGLAFLREVLSGL